MAVLLSKNTKRAKIDAHLVLAMWADVNINKCGVSLVYTELVCLHLPLLEN